MTSLSSAPGVHYQVPLAGTLNVDHLFDFWFENFKRFLSRKRLVNIIDRKLGY